MSENRIVARWVTVVVNTTDVRPLVTFWSKMLGVDVDRAFGEEFVWLRPQSGAKMALAFQKVLDPTPGRNRLHLDLVVDDLDRAVAEVEQAGGSRLEEHTMGGYAWRVMADPDGNEFCLALPPGS